MSDTQVRTTKERIFECAARLFAQKGYTETTIRELAKEVGFKNPASIYHYFLTKNEILEQMLEDYITFNNGIFKDKNISEILRGNPTTDGILACLQTSFPPDRAEYYFNVLCVLFQEQFRNDIVRGYMTQQIILRSERNMKTIVLELKKLGVLRDDTDPDYWSKITSSLFHTFASRMMLGIGDSTPDFVGMGMVELLRSTFDLMLSLCKA
ncbi:MAG: TetR/AcrR family transcriptional regulator [Oscillospiraceae bacterium]|nr:TetR/AcrR family transcriptional regulator [Oscillospiraceae bacterium]